MFTPGRIMRDLAFTFRPQRTQAISGTTEPLPADPAPDNVGDPEFDMLACANVGYYRYSYLKYPGAAGYLPAKHPRLD